jgi:cardiolipin synthase
LDCIVAEGVIYQDIEKFYNFCAMNLNNIPNILTLSRIAVIPFIICSFYFDDKVFAHKIGAYLFLYACITDFLDGYIARRFSLQSNFGRMFDPIADKLLVILILVMLVVYRKIQIVPCLLIISREILVSGLREFLAGLKVKIHVTNLAKFKTAMQMVAIFILMLGSKGSGIEYLDLLGQILLWCAAILTIVTGHSYFMSSVKHFRG